MVDQAAEPLSIAEAKARLLAMGERPAGASCRASLVLPAAGAALLLGILLSRRRGRGIGLLSVGALTASPALRSAAVALAGAAIRRFATAAAR